MARVRLRPGEHGEVSFARTATKQWQAKAYYRDKTGRLRRLQRTARTQIEAARKLREAQKPRTGDSGIVTVQDLATAWLAQHDQIADSTRERYQSALRWYVYPRLGQLRLGEVSTAVVDDALRDIYIDHSRSAAQRSRTVLRMALKWGLDAVWLSVTSPPKPLFLGRKRAPAHGLRRSSKSSCCWACYSANTNNRAAVGRSRRRPGWRLC